jgi:hypothetical protein
MENIQMKKYKAFTINDDGTRNKIDANSIVIELTENKIIELDLNPQSNHFGGLPIITPADEEQNTFPVFNVKPSASNVLHIYVEHIELKKNEKE